jgi:branched-chain amino acid transport system permease protein
VDEMPDNLSSSSKTRFREKWLGHAVWALLLAIAIMLPHWGPEYFVFQLTMVYVYAIAILGLNVLTGINGQISIGHSAFFAIGAYVFGVLLDQGISWYWLIPLVASVCFAAGFLFGMPALRLEGSYLALATFALALATPQLLKFTPIERWTQGSMGLAVTLPPVPFGWEMSPEQWLYDLSLLIYVLSYIFAANMVSSRTGRAWKAIRDNPLAARAMGIDTSLYKALAFGISALYAGVAGALSAMALQFISPDSYTFTLSIALVVGLVIGGASWLPGSLLGGAFILFLPNISESISKDLSSAVFGILLILAVMINPDKLRSLWAIFRRR